MTKERKQQKDGNAKKKKEQHSGNKQYQGC
jgi:hypothetical protein